MKKKKLASVSQASSPSDHDKWRRIVKAQGASGLTVAAYCREHRIGQASFYAWKKRLKGSAAGRRTAAPVRAGFVELTAARQAGAPAAATTSPLGIEIIIDSRRVRVGPGFNRELLTEVIHVLEKQV